MKIQESIPPFQVKPYVFAVCGPQPPAACCLSSAGGSAGPSCIATHVGPARPCVRARVRTSLIMQRDTQQRKTKLYNRQPTALPIAGLTRCTLRTTSTNTRHEVHTPAFGLLGYFTVVIKVWSSSCYDDYNYFNYYYYFVAFTARDLFVLREGHF